MKRYIKSTDNSSLMSKQDILNNLIALDQKLIENDMTGEVDMFGGAVMCLGLDARESTHDIDAMFRPKTDIRKLIQEVADENNLPSDWLNDGVKGFISEDGTFERFGEDIFQNLTVFMASPEYLLAMKCLSCRSLLDSPTEISDIKFLIKYLNLTSVEMVENIILEYYPESRYQPKTHYMLMEIFEDDV